MRELKHDEALLLPGCCRRSRSRPVTGSCRGPPGPRSGCWGCETGAFSSSCSVLFQLLMSSSGIHGQSTQTEEDSRRRTHTYMYAPFLFFLFCWSGSCHPACVTPLGMNGRMERWMDGREGGWIRDMDGCDRAGGRRARIRLQPAH